ncbi:Ycf66 protein N-terminus [Rivularia sp. PCC 7116]|uniref:Ycf66 family protein n=1 Tax=Rivularia sp. PCC 7116 TaxID=373994 RepID=UPI00029ECB7D|nr:Ycf66 protein N-terminus [Rivularia sp. PCC 7116]
MFYLAQVNIGTNPASLLGLLQMIFGLFYLIFLIVKLTRIWNRISSSARTFYLIQLLVFPIFIVFSGFILLFQGWRLDPILQFQQLLLSALVFYLSLKDIVFYGAQRNR